LVEYLTQLYGENIFSGSMSVLLYISALVAIAMVAKTFGIYTENLFGLTNSYPYSHYIFSVGILLSFMILNLSGSYLSSKFESFIVILKLSVLITFSFLALFYIHPSNLKLVFTHSHILNAIYAIGLTFFAYEGFRVITNTVEDIEEPNKNVPRAMYMSILFVMAVYILVTVAVFGNLSLTQIINGKEYVLALAAKSFVGELGFVIIAITALISTASSINANLYAISNVTYTMAKEGELPKEYTYNVWHNFEGLIISTFILIAMVLFFNLTQIAVIGSISILFIHLIVHIGHLRKYKKIGSNPYLLILAILSISFVIVMSIIYSYKNLHDVILFLILGLIGAFVLEILLRFLNHRVVRKQIRNMRNI
jgi:amino acid transporter